MSADQDQRQHVYRQAYRAYLHAHAPRARNGLALINRDLLDAATAAGLAAVAAATATVTPPAKPEASSSPGYSAHGLVRG